MTHNSSFAIQTPLDFFTELIEPQYMEFVQQNSSSRYALQTIFSAYHMYEWVHHQPFNEPHFVSKYPEEGRIADYFEAARRICNGTKHFKVKTQTSVQVGYSTAYCDTYERPLKLEFSKNQAISANQLLRELFEFWDRHRCAKKFSFSYESEHGLRGNFLVTI